MRKAAEVQTKNIIRLVKAAHRLDFPAAVSELNDKGGWVYVKDYEKYGKQVSAIKAALAALIKDANPPQKAKK